MPLPALAFEFVVLFILFPLGYRFSPRPLPALPCLWLVALYCYWQLQRDGAFPRSMLWNAQPVVAQLPSVLIGFLASAGALWLAMRWFAPELLFSFVRARPLFWTAVMVLYPVLSVYPQGIIYRAFLMHRYAPLLHSKPALIVVSALAFSFMHLIFRNPLAVGLTFIGGLLFAWRYEATGSLITSSFEHALYGCWLFTIGLGQYFYLGRVRLR